MGVNNTKASKLSNKSTLVTIVLSTLIVAFSAGAQGVEWLEREQAIEASVKAEKSFTKNEAYEWYEHWENDPNVFIWDYFSIERKEGAALDEAVIVCNVDKIVDSDLEKLLYYYSTDPVNGSHVTLQEMKDYLVNDLNNAAIADYQGNSNPPEPMRFLNWCNMDAKVVWKNDLTEEEADAFWERNGKAGTPLSIPVSNFEFVTSSNTFRDVSVNNPNCCYFWFYNEEQTEAIDTAWSE